MLRDPELAQFNIVYGKNNPLAQLKYASSLIVSLHIFTKY